MRAVLPLPSDWLIWILRPSQLGLLPVPTATGRSRSKSRSSRGGSRRYKPHIGVRRGRCPGLAQAGNLPHEGPHQFTRDLGSAICAGCQIGFQGKGPLYEGPDGDAVASDPQCTRFHKECNTGTIGHEWESLLWGCDVLNIGGRYLSLLREVHHRVIERRVEPAFK